MVNRFNAVENASDIDTSSFSEMRRQVDDTNAYVDQLQQQFGLAQRMLDDMARKQDGFNGSVRQGGAAVDGLAGKIGAAVAAYASIQTAGRVLSLSDELTQTAARLEMMNDGLQSTQDLQNKIFLAAQRSRGEYQAMSDSVSKLGLMAGIAFASSDEIIAFSEQLSKQFIIAGTNADGVRNAMLQLTQAMGSGVLRGDELNSIFEQAPTVIQTIADYLEAPIGSIREMAKEGQLTAGVVKAAMLSAADETNARFDQMPKTFGQIATSIGNQAVMAFQPVLSRLGELANSDAFQTFVDNAINSIVAAAGAAMMVFDAIGAAAQFANENWSWLAPIIFAVVGAYAALNSVMLIQNTIAAVGRGIKMASIALEYAHAAAKGASVAATTAETAAQMGLNAALLACPLTWIIIAVIAIVAAIYLVVGIMNKVAGASVSATGVIFGAFAALGAFLWDLFLGLLELVLGVVEALINPFIMVANFIGNVFANPISSIIYMFQGMADGVLAILQKIASALDFVFGSSMADAVAGWRSGLRGMADAAVAEHAPNENYQKIMDELDLSVGGLGLKRWDYGDAWSAGYSAGESVDYAVANFDPASLFPSSIPSADSYGGFAFDPSTIESGVGSIDANTAKQAGYSEEELKLWRDIAERDAINRFTTAQIDMGGIHMSNTVSSEMDLDGIADYIGEAMLERLEVVAEGVHD
jgi:tape measure domain-containing protein